MPMTTICDRSRYLSVNTERIKPIPNPKLPIIKIDKGKVKVHKLKGRGNPLKIMPMEEEVTWLTKKQF